MAEALKIATEAGEHEAAGAHADALLRALRRLDARLERAVCAARELYGSAAAPDPFRGLRISEEDVTRLLSVKPLAPAWPDEAPDEEDARRDAFGAGGPSPFAWLGQAFGLSDFDMDVLLVALAPELDLRYERLYAYLQDDVTRKRPTVDLTLNLLCDSAGEKLARRAHFGPDAPLFRHGLLRLFKDAHQPQPPLLSHYVKPDEQITARLLGQEGLDSRLVEFARLLAPETSLEELPLGDDTKAALLALAVEAFETGRPLRLYFRGERGAWRRRTAGALARKLGASLLCVDLARVPSDRGEFVHALRLILREAWFRSALVYFEELDALRRDERASEFGRLMEALEESGGVVILSGSRPWITAGSAAGEVVGVEFPPPDFALRRECWRRELSGPGMTPDARQLDALAGRFRLMPEQISEAVADARGRALWHAAAERQRAGALQAGPDARTHAPRPSLDALFEAARAQSSRDLLNLARQIRPKHTWADVVLPEDTLSQVREICRRVENRQRVFGDWGFDGKLSLGKGVNALFAGSSGTGKTMTAEIIARELGLDLFKINLSGLVSKYIGETEKNLERIFDAAEDANAVLFFDEADALFGKRSEVRDAHDRYANIETAYLLQKMEQYEGLAILASNLRSNLDEAFVRRLAFIIHFPFPEEVERRRIWGSVWPAETPLAPDVDLDFLAAQFKLSGGNIKNVALSAAFLAAADGDDLVRMEHIFQATRREYQKLGKSLSEVELYGPLDGTRAATLAAGDVRPGVGGLR
jgi:SpoVK/Ycf46/Vps4 family AAA+-type ATPase